MNSDEDISQYKTFRVQDVNEPASDEETRQLKKYLNEKRKQRRLKPRYSQGGNQTDVGIKGRHTGFVPKHNISKDFDGIERIDDYISSSDSSESDFDEQELILRRKKKISSTTQISLHTNESLPVENKVIDPEINLNFQGIEDTSTPATPTASITPSSADSGPSLQDNLVNCMNSVEHDYIGNADRSGGPVPFDLSVADNEFNQQPNELQASISENTLENEHMENEESSSKSSGKCRSRRKKPKLLKEELHTIEEHDQKDSSRKSKRPRIQPLEFWRLEKLIYGRRRDSLIPHVIQVLKKPHGENPKERNSTKKQRKHKKVPEMEIPQIKLKSNKKEIMKTIAKHGSLLPNSSKENMIEAFSEKEFSSGILKLSNSTKFQKETVNNKEVFYVVTGSIHINIGNQVEFDLNEGAHFWIPAGKSYSIASIDNSKCLLTFVSIK